MTTDINVLSEFERAGIEYQYASDDTIKCRCPFHDDDKPSCVVTLSTGAFHCFASGCNQSGDILTFLARVLKTSRAVVFTDLAQRYNFDAPKLIDVNVVERCHTAIWQAKPLLKALYDRGVTDDDIRKYRLGEREGRIIIPIKNESGFYVNLRKYLPGAPGSEKMRNTRGHGKIRLFPLDQLRYDEIVICGGEIKAIVAARQLNARNIGAITATAGEGNWDTSLTPRFAGKRVHVCMDIDEGGRSASELLCGRLMHNVRWLSNITLPLDLDKYPKGDINDFVARERGDLFTLIKDAKEWRPQLRSNAQNDDDIIHDVELGNASRAEYVAKRIRFKAIVSGIGTSPFVIPKDFEVDCDRSLRECAICPINLFDKNKFELNIESDAIIQMIDSNRTTQQEALKYSVGIPQTCRICSFEAHTYYNVEDARVSPQLEITDRAIERVLQPAIIVGSDVELNESYLMTGRAYPHPKTQASTLLVSHFEPTQDALSTYECNHLQDLHIFQPDSWTVEALQIKLDNIYKDLESNVTRIYQRRDLHLAVDLGYHSPLFFRFDGRTVKGWTEILICGDSSQGKSEVGAGAMRHYKLGEKVECKNASVAGLLGGLQKMGDKRWLVTWGIIPTHDKRLVILEELKGAPIEVISKLTDMRSSGVAEIPKIEKRRTHARTRLIALSNPRSELPVSSYNFGVDVIKELIGNPEDIRRFDLCLLLAKEEIDSSLLNVLQNTRATVDHVYTSELCRSLILWVWTRDEHNVVFDDDAVNLVLNEATLLTTEFSDIIPILDKGSTRYKIARLAAALAARTFSCSDDMLSLRVRKCHVEYVCKFLRKIYNSPVCGYADLTAAAKIITTLIDPEQIKRKVNETPFPTDLIKQLLRAEEFNAIDIQDWCGWERPESVALISFFVRKHAIVRQNGSYRKTPMFIQLLKMMLVSGEITQRPDYVEEF